MVGSRTIRVLTALVAAMTVGAFALIWMLENGEPVRIGDKELAALRAPSGGGVSPAVFQTDVPRQPLKWQNIIIHTTGAERNIAGRCHFVIASGGGDADDCIRTGALWKRQAEGNHIYVPGFDYNANSIGVCVVGDFSQHGPSRVQFEALVSLVNSLQRAFGIPRDRVYLHSDLVRTSRSPGQAFPTERFNRRLIRTQH